MKRFFIVFLLILEGSVFGAAASSSARPTRADIEAAIKNDETDLIAGWVNSGDASLKAEVQQAQAKFAARVHLLDRSKAFIKKRRESYFSQQSRGLQLRIYEVLHPLLHVLNQDSLAKSVDSVGASLCRGEFSSAWSEVKKTYGSYSWERIKRENLIWSTLKNAVSGLTIKLPFASFALGVNGDIAAGSVDATLELMNKAAGEIKDAFPDFDIDETCPGGIGSCPMVGQYSKKIITQIEAFLRNIATYEVNNGHQYFLKGDTQKVFKFLADVVVQICEESILTQASEGASVPDDKERFKPYLKVVNYLVGLPTECHNVQRYYELNMDKLKRLFSPLPLEAQRELHGFIRVLASHKTDPQYGHAEGTSSTNLIFMGPSGTGKTYTGRKLIELLGFHEININFRDLLECLGASASPMEYLTSDDKAPVLEQMLQLDEGGKRGVACLNQVVFVDEVDRDRIYSASEIKEAFDQFRRIRFGELNGIEIPGLLFCIFTTNNTEPFGVDDAAQARFKIVQFPPMPLEVKRRLLYECIFSKLCSNEQYARLKNEYDFLKVTQEIVAYNGSKSIRELLVVADNIILFFIPDDFFDQEEPFEDFCQRTLGDPTPSKSATREKSDFEGRSRSISSRDEFAYEREAFDESGSDSSDDEYVQYCEYAAEGSEGTRLTFYEWQKQREASSGVGIIDPTESDDEDDDEDSEIDSEEDGEEVAAGTPAEVADLAGGPTDSRGYHPEPGLWTAIARIAKWLLTDSDTRRLSDVYFGQ